MQNDNVDIQDTPQSDQPAPPKKKRGGGPKTPEGKARSSRNAVVHGFTATQFTFLAHEEYAELDEIIDRYMQDFQPTSQIAIDLVNELASCRLRLNRISNTESWLYQLTMGRLQGKPGSIDVPDGHHSFDCLDHTDQSRAAVERAFGRVQELLLA